MYIVVDGYVSKGEYVNLWYVYIYQIIKGVLLEVVCLEINYGV